VSGPSLLPDAVPRVTYGVLIALVAGHGKGDGTAQPRWQSVYRSPQAREARYVNCGTSVGDGGDPTPLFRAMSKGVFRGDATSAPGSAELQRVGPFLGIISMFEVQEPALLATRQEHRQADVIRVGP